MKEEIDQDIELDKMDHNSADKNPYRELIVNNAGKIENTLSQMEQCSILSNVINYVQYSKNPKNFDAMSVKSTNKNKINIGRRQGRERWADMRGKPHRYIRQIDKRNLDRHKGVKSEILVTTRFDENSDLSMTYLGKTSMIRDHKMVSRREISNVRTRLYNR